MRRLSARVAASTRARDVVIYKREAIRQAICALLEAVNPAVPDLGTRAVQYGSDKWGAVHWYTSAYEQYFRPFRDRCIRLLEIGIGGYADPHRGGGSLRLWSDYFRRGLLCGLDICPKAIDRRGRIRTVTGDQSDPQVLNDLAQRFGPFDIIIDDGSHMTSHTLASFDNLFRFLVPGGVYVIEDLQMSYLPQFGGNSTGVGTTPLALIKTLIDGIHADEIPSSQDPAHTSHWSDLDAVCGVSVRRNIAFIEKGSNRHGSAKWDWQRGRPTTVGG